MKKIKDIDFNNKDVTGTEYYFSFFNKRRPEGWTINDELMLLTLYIQKNLIWNVTGKAVYNIMDWRQNVSKAINETVDKLEDEEIFENVRLKNWQESEPGYQSYADVVNIVGNKLLVFANGQDGSYVKTDEGNQAYEKDVMLREAKELAKAEILAQQEHQKAIEEAEAEKEAEEETNQMVFPLKNYGK